jgi:hypothetical protein
MLKLFENKQIIHIATEIVALIGIIFYFSSKNKKLLEHIEDISQRLEDQEDLIQKHEQIIKQLVHVINTRGSLINKEQPESPKLESKSIVKRKKPNPLKRLVTPSSSFNDDEEVEETYEPSVKVIEDESSDDDSDLDAEIADELQELQQDGLKKRK